MNEHFVTQQWHLTPSLRYLLKHAKLREMHVRGGELPRLLQLQNASGAELLDIRQPNPKPEAACFLLAANLGIDRVNDGSWVEEILD